MNIVPEIIKPIKLLAGSHADAGTTGQGCFMNVVAYLNGEAQITDNSPCVCITVRPLAIKLNDCGTDEQRQRLLPFVLRAMGSATKDKAVLDKRVARLRQYGAECQELLHAWRAEMKAKFGADASASASADASADAYASASASADAYASAYADAYASAYADAGADASASASAYAYAYADAYASASASADAYAAKLKASLFDAGLRYLDDVLPQADVPTGEILERAQKLCELAT